MSRRALIALPAALIAVVAVVWFAKASSGPSDTRPVVLPPTFMGLNVSSTNHRTSSAALPVMHEVFGAAPVGLAQYGENHQTSVVNVLATRTDMTGKSDLHFLGDNGRLFGSTRCTQNLVLRDPDEDMDTPGSPMMKGLVLCWRTSDQLSISAFALVGTPAETDLALAVDQLWETLR